MIRHETDTDQSNLPAIVGAIVTIILGNIFLFTMNNRSGVLPQELPYFEDFSAAEQPNFRLIGDGSWSIQDQQLLQQDPTLSDIMAVIPGLDLAEDQAYEFSSNMSVLDGPKGGGLIFNIQNARELENSHMVRMGTADGTDYLVYGYFDPSGNYISQGSVQIENVSSNFKLGVDVTPSSYGVLINDQTIATDIPLQYSGGALAMTSWNSKVAFDNVSVNRPSDVLPIVEAQPPAEAVVVESQPDPVGPAVVDPVPAEQVPVQPIVEQPVQVAAPVIASGELPYFEDFTDDVSHNFDVLTGEWELRNGQLVQTNPRIADVAAVVPGIALSPDQRYEFSSNIDVLEGPHGGGLMFNMQTPDSIAESHMLRLGSNDDGSKYLIYGFFDVDGRFNWQGDTQPRPFNQQAKLGISVFGNNFNLLMNDEVLVENIPLVYKGGRVGVTTWNSSIGFDSMSLYDPTVGGVTLVEPPEEVFETTLPWFEDFTGDEDHAFIDVGGNWQLREETMLQLNTDAADVLAMLPGLILSPDEAYDFNTDIRVLEGPKGGGIAFNAQNIDSISESHLVRFGSNDGNDFLIYGFFDDNRSFNVQGSFVPEIEDEARLGVSVSGTSYDILIDNEVVARDIPLTYLGGRAALSTWNSSVLFDNIEVTTPFETDGSTAEAAEVVEETEAAVAETATADEAALADEAEAIAEEPAPETEQPATEEAVAEENAGVTETADAAPEAAPISPVALDINAETDPSNWNTVQGEWTFSVDGLTHPDGQEGNSTILYTTPLGQYSMRATLSMGSGSGGAGVVFNVPENGGANSGHVVRYQSNEVVAWGYFGEGGSFVEQGLALVPPAGSGEHTFAVESNGSTYTLRLDGEVIAQDQELFYAAGNVGFISNARETTISSMAISPIEE
ncbi:MAG: hypothetical protein AAF902_17060 [Chloroflexota bacterium]